MASKARVVEPDIIGEVVKLEAAGVATRAVEHAGLTFHVPTDVNDWPVRVVLDFEQERPMSGVRALLPEAEFAAYLATEPTLRDFGQLAEALFSGVGAGN